MEYCIQEEITAEERLLRVFLQPATAQECCRSGFSDWGFEWGLSRYAIDRSPRELKLFSFRNKPASTLSLTSGRGFRADSPL
jgi:hypothetical protein